mmetsp:Transcript_16551/g.18724  ORF Transcript_16551/g.18724 Transcript_16551/m.18724 type:complete len:107 (-) Transcript_16551:1102-1422(-)
MSDFWANAKAKAAKVAEQAKSSSLQTKLLAEKKMLERKIRVQKEEFGKEVYESMATENSDLTKQIFLKHKEIIDDLSRKIVQKDKDISDLKLKANDQPTSSKGTAI